MHVEVGSIPTRLRQHQGSFWNTEGCLCISICPRLFAEDGANARLTAHAPPTEIPKVIGSGDSLGWGRKYCLSKP